MPPSRARLLTGVSFDPSQVGVMGYDGARFFSYFNRRDPAVYHGTGDLLASATVGGLMRGLPLEQALQLAVDFTLRAIELTRSDSQATWYGVEFERAIPWLTRRLEELGK